MKFLRCELRVAENDCTFVIVVALAAIYTPLFLPMQEATTGQLYTISEEKE